jgi:peptide subunit release factor 1 (eRF1)
MFEPPKKLDKKLYMCDKKFHLNSIIDMYAKNINYGIALISGKEYRYYVVEITGIHREFKLLCSNEITLQKKQKKGGQSAQRISRIREEKELLNIRKMAELFVITYMTNNNTKCIIDKLIIAGPSDMKHKLLEEDIIKQYFPKNILRVVSTSEITDSTIYEVYNKNQDLFVTHDNKLGNEIMIEVNNLINIGFDKLVFGFKEVSDSLNNKILKKIIISCEMDKQLKNKLYELMYDKCLCVEINKNMFNGLGEVIGIKFNEHLDITEEIM